MVADHRQHEIVALAQEGGAHAKAGPHFETARLELAQPEAAVDVRAAKYGRQLAQPREQISARACRQRGELGGGAAGLEDSHRERRR